ncbi:chemotaxis protein CheA [Cytophagaceae bacterium DM2B3-1]|uniref:Chemotaxis protein CheA n=1 Tax=Xanthocytophaga flava TaxID=3048013 RepID=A0ABT7CJF7_9BACT|nr:chemotaxis protein CheA [Xanthocytophaga flavus]MDJ1493871.1 chemotaxis protein CheA [Xanthocytophaga flavus]
MDSLHEKFLEEVTEFVADLENALLELEKNPENQKLIEKVFRIMHTLKGTSAMFGFDKIGNLTHDLETIYEFIREQKTVLSEEILSLTFASIDFIKILVETNNELPTEEYKLKYETLLFSIKRKVDILEGNHSATSETANSSALGEDTPEIVSDEKKIVTYYIQFIPAGHLLTTGVNPLYMIDDLYALGECKVFLRNKNVPDLSQIQEESCYLSWDIFLGTSEEKSTIADVFLFAEDACTLKIHKIADKSLLQDDAFIQKMKELSVVTEGISLGSITAYLHNASKESARKQEKAEPQKELVVEDEPKVSLSKIASSKNNSLTSIRVASRKLDEMMNVVSELITMQARLTLLAEKNNSTELTAIAENFDKLLRQLRDNSLKICLVPMETIFSRFQRLVRDLSKDLQKNIIFSTEGGETEVDKTIIENLSDPILHLLRNSIDHGIEDAETRIRNGKSAQGKIHLKAFYSEGMVQIVIEDDGKGIDPKRIREKAIEKGILSETTPLTDKEAINLIFLPGFSTAQKVSEISGRGVGMDVVRQRIEELRGEIYIDSKVNKGTTMTIKLPLSLSIIDGILVKADDTCFVIPLSAVDKCYEIRHDEIHAGFNDLVIIDGEQVPFYYLREEFAISGEAPAIEQIVTITYEGQKIALIVDRIVGEYQSVLKPLGAMGISKGQELLLGATIMGDGTVALVLDSGKIVKQLLHKVFI